jgi:hypothetical protein
MYIPLSSTTPIFIGGLLRWATDWVRGKSASESETETSPGVLLASGFIAGGTLCGLIIAFFAFLGDAFNNALNLGQHISKEFGEGATSGAKLIALAAFVVLALVLWFVGVQKSPEVANEPVEPSG